MQKEIVLGIIIFAAGFWIGYIVGFGNAISAVAELAKPFVDVDVEMIEQAITRYKTHMIDCYN